MSVKSKVEVIQSVPLSYPVLMKWRHSGETVLFTRSNTGTVVVKGSVGTGKHVGDYATDFVDATDRSWERVPVGTQIILANGE